jgi:hypothetical protein
LKLAVTVLPDTEPTFDSAASSAPDTSATSMAVPNSLLLMIDLI